MNSRERHSKHGWIIWRKKKPQKLTINYLYFTFFDLVWKFDLFFESDVAVITHTKLHQKSAFLKDSKMPIALKLTEYKNNPLFWCTRDILFHVTGILSKIDSSHRKYVFIG